MDRRDRVLDGRTRRAARYFRTHRETRARRVRRRAAHARQIHAHVRRATREARADSFFGSARRRSLVREMRARVSGTAVHGGRACRSFRFTQSSRRLRAAIATCRAAIGSCAARRSRVRVRSGSCSREWAMTASEGARAIRAAGGTVIAESAETAVVYGMPGRRRSRGPRVEGDAAAADRRVHRDARVIASLATCRKV